MLGLCLALRNNFYPLLIETDSQVLLKILNTTSTKYSSITSDCTDLLDELSDPVLSHIYRESNNVADILAHYGQTMATEDYQHLFLFVTPPTCTMKQLSLDLTGTESTRSIP
ncbi:hypothetical protein HAX54_051068 [Datura stramonium]|uniref:RNase H type-1 domain-containing protein n=1 Tax=Datura stramonium TaxID=4076 RepID=A0ABS8WP92_DATST|nr:hypothetical protein [Datura stramonium]